MKDNLAKIILTKNYHTHLYRCKHAQGDVADYCQAALEAGLQVLGISDHTPLPDNRWSKVRMDMRELPLYCQSIDEARQRFSELSVLKGMECDYDDSYISFYRDELLGHFKLDYLIGAIHYIPHNGEWIGVYGKTTDAATLKSYSRQIIKAMESGLFAFIAHPDLFANAYLKWDAESQACSRAILAAAAALKVPLEINGYGLRKPVIETPEGKRFMYPWERFWELATDYDIEVIINSDAHQPADVVGKMDEAAKIALKYSLTVTDLMINN